MYTRKCNSNKNIGENGTWHIVGKSLQIGCFLIGNFYGNFNFWTSVKFQIFKLQEKFRVFWTSGKFRVFWTSAKFQIFKLQEKFHGFLTSEFLNSKKHCFLALQNKKNIFSLFKSQKFYSHFFWPKKPFSKN
jgi:hypothetical protein